MRPSLERHLTHSLGFTIILAGFLAGIISLTLAYMEAQEFQDNTLRQIAALLDNNFSSKQSTSNEPNISDIDPEEKIKIMSLQFAEKTAGLPTNLSPGFHSVYTPKGYWRIFIQKTNQGSSIVVAQATKARNEIAINSALRTLVPLVILLPLLVWLARHIIRNELNPLRVLAQKLEHQPAEHPEALPDAGIPNEILPFIHGINGQMQRIKRLMEQQERFIADAAHELRTPLTALSLQLQNLQQANTLKEMRLRINPLKTGIERARRMTEQLLSLAKNKTYKHRMEHVDLSKMARELIADYLPLAEARSLDLGLEDAGNLTLYTEPDTLLMILRNALENSIQYTPNMGQVTLRLHAEGDDMVIEVCDTGKGIPVSERERVFDPFYRINDQGGEGSGLGLAIVNDAAKRLGGTVTLKEPANGTGLIFYYRQPRVP
ncbi:MAG: HAMP domain-containing histidine kinase [Pseudomonadota bacterium]|nr:HAMP domain-containing histidine kinase [Pseudomonadota bacterium]